MFSLTIPETELWDEKTEEFIRIKPCTLTLEHSLVSISKWESKWKRPFFKKPPENEDELLDYIKCMTITQNVNDLVYRSLTYDSITKIGDYMNDPMTATWFMDKNRRGRDRVVTSELVYCWMFKFNIPIECQKWHINRLMTLIRVCAEENGEPEKMSKKDMAALNKARRKARRR